MEMDFASKVEEAYKTGKNKAGFNEAVNYIQNVVKKAELEEKKVPETEVSKKVRDEDDYEK